MASDIGVVVVVVMSNVDVVVITVVVLCNADVVVVVMFLCSVFLDLLTGIGVGHHNATFSMSYVRHTKRGAKSVGLSTRCVSTCPDIVFMFPIVLMIVGPTVIVVCRL